MKKYIKPLVFFTLLVISSQTWANSGTSTVPEPFQGFDESSRLTISYTDLDSLFDAVVLDTGRSNRKKAAPPKSSTGTRMKFSINRATVNEGNRFFFEIFAENPENKKVLQQIRKRLEDLPTANPLEKFSRDEQLAYWINLYNVTIVDEIVKIYPERELEDLLVGKKSVLPQKILNVAGVPLSLNDIQFTILRENYDSNPLVIYGLYQGIIGGPNIRKNAYTGKYVYADLIDNAIEFINSNRGTESTSASTFRVSSFYQRNQPYFADFQPDLTAHLLAFLEGQQVAELKSAQKIKPDIDDWTTTDLYGSSRDLGGSFGTNNAALLSGVAGASSSRLTSKSTATTSYSPAVLNHLAELNKKREAEKTGTVTIEEIGTATDQQDDSDSG